MDAGDKDCISLALFLLDGSGDEYVVKDMKVDKVVLHNGIRTWRSIYIELEHTSRKLRKFRYSRVQYDGIKAQNTHEHRTSVCEEFEFIRREFFHDNSGTLLIDCAERWLLKNISDVPHIWAFFSAAPVCPPSYSN